MVPRGGVEPPTLRFSVEERPYLFNHLGFEKPEKRPDLPCEWQNPSVGSMPCIDLPFSTFGDLHDQGFEVLVNCPVEEPDMEIPSSEGPWSGDAIRAGVLGLLAEARLPSKWDGKPFDPGSS
jgi:hypothetical protein